MKVFDTFRPDGTRFEAGPGSGDGKRENRFGDVSGNRWTFRAADPADPLPPPHPAPHRPRAPLPAAPSLLWQLVLGATTPLGRAPVRTGMRRVAEQAR